MLPVGFLDVGLGGSRGQFKHFVVALACHFFIFVTMVFTGLSGWLSRFLLLDDRGCWCLRSR